MRGQIAISHGNKVHFGNGRGSIHDGKILRRMTTPEQRLFVAQQVYKHGTWAIEGEPGYENIISLDKDYPDFDPENNAEQRWDMLMWGVNHKDFSAIKKQKIRYWAHNDFSFIHGPLNSETLIHAICVLGGFDETK